jgi:antitoxin HicB
MPDYPIELAPDDNGTLLVTSPDFPELTTFGEDEISCVLNAADALEEAIAARIARREEVPSPSPAEGRPTVRLATRTRLKIRLYQSMRDKGVSKAELARRMTVHPPQVDRLLDLNHHSDIDQIDAAFKALGERLGISVEAA